MLLIVLAPFAVGAPDPDPVRSAEVAAYGLRCGLRTSSMGVALPRHREQQAKLGKRVSRHALEPGDLVFYNTRNRPYSHVGIYIGDGRFVHAQAGASCAWNAHLAARFNGARRLAPPR